MPSADDREVAFDALARRRPDALHAAVALEGRDALAEQRLDAVLAVKLGDRAADLRAEDPLEREPQTASIAATSSPAPRSVAATSEPMKPMPTTTARRPGARPRAGSRPRRRMVRRS